MPGDKYILTICNIVVFYPTQKGLKYVFKAFCYLFRSILVTHQETKLIDVFKRDTCTSYNGSQRIFRHTYR